MLSVFDMVCWKSLATSVEDFQHQSFHIQMLFSLLGEK